MTKGAARRRSRVSKPCVVVQMVITVASAECACECCLAVFVDDGSIGGLEEAEVR